MADFDPSSIPVPPAPPTNNGGTSDRDAAWAAAQAALQRVKPVAQPLPPPPPAPLNPLLNCTQYPWMIERAAAAAVAAQQTYPNYANYTPAVNGNWNPNGPSKPQNAGWNGNNHLVNQFNQVKNQWNHQKNEWQTQTQPSTPQWNQNQNNQGWKNGQQQSQQYQNNGQQQKQQWNQNQNQNGTTGFKGFTFNKPLNGKLPNLQNSFVKQGGGPVGFGDQVCEQAPQFGQVPESVRKYMERSLAAAPDSDRQRVLDYLEKRLRPLLVSGGVRMVKWELEPLPHTKNYELPTTWTPAASKDSPQKSTTTTTSSSSTSSGFTWANPPKGQDSRRRRRVSPSSSSSSESGRSRRDSTTSTKRSADGWYEDRERRSPSVECIAETQKPLSKRQQKKLQKQAKQMKLKLEKTPKKEKKNMRFTYDDPNEASRKADRRKRFAQDVIVAAPSVPYRPSRNHIVIGTCTDIEKKYFRLTAAPDPATVRPLHVLRESLQFLKDNYKKDAEYRYMCDQFRSIRQDLTVQRIRNSFTVEVYEIHARIALENKDREDFNKCQSQLKVLYEEVPNSPNEAEFTAYRLLYYVAMQNTIDVSTLLRSLTPEMRQDKCVSFALKVRNKLTMGDQVGFFKLYESKAPLMCAYLLDMFVERERNAAMNAFVKAYRPSLKLSTIAQWLVMDEDELIDWLKKKEIVNIRMGGEFDCKAYANTVFV